MSRRGVLVVAPFLPLPADFGGALRVYHLVRQLSREHDVLFLAPATREEWRHAQALADICDVTVIPANWTPRRPADARKRLRQIAALAHGRSFLEHSARDTRVQAAIDRLFLTRRIDLVQFEFSQMGVYTTPRPCPRVVDVHNIEHALLQRVAATSLSASRRMFNLLESRRVRALERRVFSSATLCMATSDVDARAIEALGGRARVVPNGVDIDRFAGVARRPDGPLVLFTGAMRHAPNADGTRWYIDRVHPLVRAALPDARVAIVGADPPPDLVARASSDVLVTGWVADILPWLGRAALAIAPLHAGGGTRLKIIEALAAGVPVVSTSVGAEGLDLSPGSDILLADTPEAFAAAVLRLLHDRDLAASLACRGRAIARGRFAWQAVAQRLIAAHDEAIEQFGSRRAE